MAEQPSDTQKKDQAEQLKQQEDVKRAFKQTTTNKPPGHPKAKTKDKLLLGTHLVIVLALAAIHYLFRLNFKLFSFISVYIPLIQRLTTAAMLLVLISAIGK